MNQALSFLLLFFPLFFYATHVVAQAPVTQQSSAAKSTADNLVSEHAPEVIEVLAPKQHLTLSSTSGATSYLDERFSFSADRTIADRLITIPGVSLNGQGGQFQSYAVRGFSRGRIKTEIDGIAIITDRRAGNSASFIAPDLLSSGQVIKGPSSAIYGSQAMGGVVSLSSEMADGSSVKLAGQTGNQGLNLTLKHQQDNLSAGFAYQHGNNQDAPNGERLHTEYQRLSGLLRYQLNHSGLITTFSWLGGYGDDIGKSNSKFPATEISNYLEDFHSLAQVQVNADAGWLAKVFHHYQNWDSSTLKPAQYDALTQYQSHTIGGQWLQPFSLAESNSNWGIDWLSRDGVKITSDYQLVDTSAESEQQLIGNELRGSEDNLAIYSNTSWNSGKAKFDLGVRYDWIRQQSEQAKDVYDNHFNLSLATRFAATDNLELGLDLANGFRYPTLSERYFNGQTPRAFIVGNPDLKSETSIGSELSATWQASEHLTIHQAVYYYALDDYIERYSVNDDVLSYRNLDEATIYGFETELQYQWSDSTEHHFSYQQQRGEDEQDQTLADLHPAKLSWIMLYNYQDWSFANSVNYYFDSDDVNASELARDSYVLWNLSIDHQFSNNQTISLSIDNATDEEYYASLDEDAALQPERSVKLSSTWRL